MKKVLITGANSYIGTSFEKYVKQHYADQLSIDTVDMVDGSWRTKDFSPYDIVYHVAGIAHADVGKVDEATKAKYYAINTDLAIECCKKAKADGVGQFVFMSSAIVYGKQRHISKDTKPQPSNFYGDSKWKADKGVRCLASTAENGEREFVVTVLRSPMIYGKGSKGNYPTLSRLAQKLPVFPEYQNKRSMLYIENLCEFLSIVMIRGLGGIFWPQNREYSSTSDIVRTIAAVHNHKIIVSKLLSPVAAIAKCIPGKIGGMAKKAFGDSWYEADMSRYEGIDYQIVSLSESIEKTEDYKI